MIMWSDSGTGKESELGGWAECPGSRRKKKPLLANINYHKLLLTNISDLERILKPFFFGSAAFLINITDHTPLLTNINFQELLLTSIWLIRHLFWSICLTNKYFWSRNHVHFSAGEPGEDGVISGMRKSAGVISEQQNTIFLGTRGFRGEYFYLSRSQWLLHYFFFPVQLYSNQVFRAEILVRNSSA